MTGLNYNKADHAAACDNGHPETKTLAAKYISSYTLLPDH